MVGRKDNPIYELDLQNTPPNKNSQAAADPKKDDSKPLNQLIVHSALDAVEEAAWTTTSMYLKVVDKYNESFISAFISAGSIKLLLLHDTKNEDGIKNFFQDVHETYIKILMNPFYEPSSKIISAVFDTKVKGFAKKYL